MPKTKKAVPAASTTAPADIEQAKQDLLARAKKAGEIDQKDITALLADTPENVDALDALYTELADAGVQVKTAESGGPGEDGEDFSDEWVAEDGEEILPDVNDQSYLDDIADDSVRLYLR